MRRLTGYTMVTIKPNWELVDKSKLEEEESRWCDIITKYKCPISSDSNLIIVWQLIMAVIYLTFLFLWPLLLSTNHLILLITELWLP
jgi:hypothetical protein